MAVVANSSAVLPTIQIGNSSCKPKEAVVSGEAFIVSGNENIKLGLVEVQLIPKTEVVEFLNQKLPVIGLEISKRRRESRDAEREAKTVSDEMKLFSTNNPWTKWVATWPTRPDYPSPESIKAHNVALEEKSVKESEFSKKYAAAVSRRIETVLANGSFPQPEVYFEDSHFPKGIQKVLTDADGKFSLKYTNEQAFALFAKSESTFDNKLINTFGWSMFRRMVNRRKFF